ncbi:unnamed protein product [Adineta steineri]|uniref:Dolichyl-phosphate beta-glucosyltransferase n=1 Tax=Adineta steineri TaxID=433720 RepID=A0A818VX65_9BILA|nr:unnamed protein product [Adineta steineri]CAF3717209.1 unnamed protein product [Adineta steineri]
MIEQLFSACIVLAILGLIVLSIICLLRSFNMAARSENEKYFQDPITKSRKQFPSLNDSHSKYLSVIIPAYKEVDRLPTMIKDTMSYLEQRQAKDQSFTYELIIVDDGSPDKTSEVALQYSKQYGTDIVRVLTLDVNRGKGGAGVLSARGQWILFADADGATKFSDFTKVENKARDNIKNNNIVVCGSRRHLEQDSVSKRSAFRTLLMYVFHFEVWLFAVKSIRDTQCGFKLFSRESAKRIFSQMHVERWAFDVEVLYIAEKLNIPIVEVDVNWQEIPGSKLDPFTASIQMGIDILAIWLRYILGIWTIQRKND